VAALALLAFALGAVACDESFSGSVNPSAVSCQVSASMPIQSLAATGGPASLRVTALPECAWQITPTSSWITGVTPASGQGEQQVSFVVAANPAPQARQGEIVINALRLTVRQDAAAAPPPPPPPAADTAPPTVTMSVPATTLPVNQAVALTATATDNVGVARVEFHANGVLISADTTAPYAATWTPTQTVTYGLRAEGVDAAGNRGLSPQVNVTVTATAPPPPPPCSYVLAATSATVGAAGGTVSVGVTTGASCTWTVQSAVPWITVTSASSGLGPFVVTLTVAPNAGAARTGTVSIANQTFTVNQATVCTYDIKPDRIRVSENGATGLTVDVSAAAGCAWTAVSNATWITITAGATGGGSGVVTFNVAPNPGDDRTGTVTIAGRTLRVDQDEND
jgi:hypothetical protein